MQSRGPWTTFERLRHQLKVALQTSVLVQDQAELDMDHIRRPTRLFDLSRS